MQMFGSATVIYPEASDSYQGHRNRVSGVSRVTQGFGEYQDGHGQ